MATYTEAKTQAMQLFGQLVKIHPSDVKHWNPERVRRTLYVDYFSFNNQAERDLSASGNSKAFWEAVSAWSKKALEKQQTQQQETINGYTKQGLADMWNAETGNLENESSDDGNYEDNNFPNEDILAHGWSVIEPTPKLHLMKCDFMWDEENDCPGFQQENDERCENELTPVATVYMHESQAYFEVWQGEECLDGGLLFQCQSDPMLDRLCDLTDLPELKPNYFISWHCLAFYLKTTFNLIARCYCRISINTASGYEKLKEYYANKHIEAMELSIKSSGLIPEALVFDVSYSSDNDNFFFQFIEATQIISHSVDLSFIDGFSSDFESLFEVLDNPMVAIESGALKVADCNDSQHLVDTSAQDAVDRREDINNGFDLAEFNKRRKESIDYSDNKLLDEIRASILPQ